jgi:hypothetical protein
LSIRWTTAAASNAVIASQRSRECVPDDRLREAIHRPTVIASEAKQSMRLQERKLDCFVASLLAMTHGYAFTIPRRDAPEALMNSSG